MFAAIVRPFSALATSLRSKKSTKTDENATGPADAAPRVRPATWRNIDMRLANKLPDPLPAAETGLARTPKSEPSAVLAMLLRPHEASNEATTKVDLDSPPAATIRARTLGQRVSETSPTRTTEMVSLQNNDGPVWMPKPGTPAAVAHPLPALPVSLRPTEHEGVEASTKPLPPPPPTDKPRAPIVERQPPRPVQAHPLPGLPESLRSRQREGVATADSSGSQAVEQQTPARPSVATYPSYPIMSLRPEEPTSGDMRTSGARVPQALQSRVPPTRPATVVHPLPSLPVPPRPRVHTNGGPAPVRPREPANRNAGINTNTSPPPAAGIKALQTPPTRPAMAMPAAIPRRPRSPTNEDAEICRDAVAFAETRAPQTRAPQTRAPQTRAPQTSAPQTRAPQTSAPQIPKPQPLETPPVRTSVMEHPFFALAMSLRPIGISDGDSDAGESAYSSSARIERPYARVENPRDKPLASKAPRAPPKAPAAMMRPGFEPTVSVRRREGMNNAEASTHTPDALPRALTPQNPEPRAPNWEKNNAITPGAAPERPTAQPVLGEEAQSRRCPQCHPNRMLFKTQTALKMHLASGYHERENQVPTQPASSNHPDTAPRVSSRGNVRHGDNDPATPSQQGRVPTRDVVVSTLASAVIQQISETLVGTARITVLNHLLEEIDVNLPGTQMLILSPTRDLALRIAALLTAQGTTCYACVGGTLVHEDKKNLAAGPHVVSGTLGRVADMLQRRSLQTRHLTVLVLNREDELLKKIYHEQLAGVYQFLGPRASVVRAAVGAV